MKRAKPTISLRRWIWRAFVHSALVPLLLVETVLVAAYLLSNSAIRDAQIESLRASALVDLQSSANLEAQVIEEQLERIAAATELYRSQVRNALLDEQPVAPTPLVLSSDGVHYSAYNEGGAAFFYSSHTPAAQHDLQKAARLARIDPLMKELRARNPLIGSLYFNTWDSLNHIYPWFLTLNQYPRAMDIPSYNFYYLADAKHNPKRQLVWTDVYLDPAGQGWMMSAIAPVYRDDFLEGVAGIDITVGRILEQIGKLPVAWNGYALLVSRDSNIMALPRAGEDDFGLRELTAHTYQEAVSQELFKPGAFNLKNRPETQALAEAVASSTSGVQNQLLNGRPHLVAWARIAQTDWSLLTVVDEADLFAQTNALAKRYAQIGYLLIGALILFYVLFFSLMWQRSRFLSEKLSVTMERIRKLLSDIGQGRFRAAVIPSSITELAEMAEHANQIGAQLEDSRQSRNQSQSRLHLVLECATEALWEFYLESGQVRIRGRFAQRFAYPERSSIEQFQERVHPDDRDRLTALAQELREHDSETVTCEFRFADAQQRYHWLLCRGRVVERNESGQPLCVAGTYVDIGAQKAVEADLRQAIGEAQNASQSKSRFISSISHELRTPLNAISGFTQLLRLDHPNASGAPDYLDEILVACQHLNQLVGDILDWSSAQVERPKLKVQALDVATEMHASADMIRLEARARNLQLQLIEPTAPVQVLADSRRLRQILLNLLSNAVKYNSPHGQITLGCEPVGNQLRLYVSDTGLGLSHQQQSQLFEPFQRLGRENSTIQGTGIGLALCRELAELMGGRMGLHSTPGAGSCFWIELPLAQESDEL